MKQEVSAGMAFLRRLLEARGEINPAKAQVFTEKLFTVLCKKFQGHWYPECPSRGQAYRCIRTNLITPWDEEIRKACYESEVIPIALGLPPEFTLWIDPLEVAARFGEESWPFTVVQFHLEEETQSSEEEQHESSDYQSTTSSECTYFECTPTAWSDSEEEAIDGEKTNRAEYYQKVPAAPQLFPPPQPLCPRYESSSPVFITPVRSILAPPPPPGFKALLFQQPYPQLVVPQAPIQPWGYYRH